MARTLDMRNDNQIEKLKALDIETKSHMTVLNAETIDILQTGSNCAL